MNKKHRLREQVEQFHELKNTKFEQIHLETQWNWSESIVNCINRIFIGMYWISLNSWVVFLYYLYCYQQQIQLPDACAYQAISHGKSRIE